MDAAQMQTWYYSSNGERRGPVSFEELQALASRGALDAVRDLAWTEGMSDWKPSGQVPGLFASASMATADGFNPYAAPSTASQDLLAPVPACDVPEINPGTYPLEVMRVLSRAMEITNRHFGPVLGIGVVYLILTMIIEGGFEFLNKQLGLGSLGLLPGGILPDSPYALEYSHPVISLISWMASTFLQLGLTRIALNFASGDESSVAMLFGQGDKLLRALGAGILYYLMVAAGLVLLIVPGVYLALRFVMYQDAIVDKNMGVMEALKYSSELTRNNKFSLFGLGLMSILVILAGALALLVGMIYAIPVVTIAFALAYRSLQYGPRAMADKPGTGTPMLQGLSRQIPS